MNQSDARTSLALNERNTRNTGIYVNEFGWIFQAVFVIINFFNNKGQAV